MYKSARLELFAIRNGDIRFRFQVFVRPKRSEAVRKFADNGVSRAGGEYVAEGAMAPAQAGRIKTSETSWHSRSWVGGAH